MLRSTIRRRGRLFELRHLRPHHGAHRGAEWWSYGEADDGHAYEEADEQAYYEEADV